MSDWQVGDLAVRVDCKCGGNHSRPASPIPSGATMRVIGVRAGPFPSCRAPCALIFTPGDAIGRCAISYHKVVPDKHEDCEPEFVTLLKRTKVPAKETASDWLLRVGPIAKQLNEASTRDSAPAQQAAETNNG